MCEIGRAKGGQRTESRQIWLTCSVTFALLHNLKTDSSSPRSQWLKKKRIWYHERYQKLPTCRAKAVAVFSIAVDATSMPFYPTIWLEERHTWFAESVQSENRETWCQSWWLGRLVWRSPSDEAVPHRIFVSECLAWRFHSSEWVLNHRIVWERSLCTRTRPGIYKN